MLEELLIFTRGGLVLWTYHELGKALKGSPINALIRSCLLEERAGDSAFQYDISGASYTLKWTFHNELGLVFVAVYQRMLHLLYVDELLDLVKQKFSVKYRANKAVYDFDDTFRQLLQEVEARAGEMKKSKQMKSREVVKKGEGKKQGDKSLGKGVRSTAKKGESEGDDDEGDFNGDASLNKVGNGVVPNGNSHGGVKARVNGRPNGVANGVSGGASSSDDDGGQKGSDAAFDVTKLAKLRNRGPKKGDSAPKPLKREETTKKAKKNRVWGDAPPPSKLDYTDYSDKGAAEETIVPVVGQGKSLMDDDEDERSSDSEIEEENVEKAVSARKGWFSSLVSSVAGKTSLEKADLGPALKVLKERLQTKNVAEDIAEKLCESVAVSLVGKKLGSFTRVSTTVKNAMEEALVRILTPKRSVDILRDVGAAKEQGRPYVITFVGVNGVGKSTNLAKVAYWLLQHNVSVMMAACDTFRSGAVEQLRTHARRLQIPIFERGYEKDPAVVAREAIREAVRTKVDVVLVDTAGRMQDNEPLMRALTKLINMNEPDLVLFVGEALVGNDAVDQLTKFNQSLVDLSSKATPRVIDGILLTKFDTIDDKVGAALSMVYVSGAPVVFVGCGQTYTDLKRLNPKSIIKSLLN